MARYRMVIKALPSERVVFSDDLELLKVMAKASVDLLGKIVDIRIYDVGSYSFGRGGQSIMVLVGRLSPGSLEWESLR